MKWLTINDIKQHLRLDCDDDDALLQLYGEAAEESILSIIGFSYEYIVARWGTAEKPIPSNIFLATLLLVDESYNHRSPSSPQQLYAVPYKFDMMLKPYMRLAADTVSEWDVVKGTQAKIAFSAELPDELHMEDVDFTVQVTNVTRDTSSGVVQKSDCIKTGADGYVVLVDTDTLGIGDYMLRVTFQIPDTDYDEGYRQEVVIINPKVHVVL